MSATAPAECRVCHRPLGTGLFCLYCGTFVLDPEGTVVMASRLSRLLAWFVNAVIFVFTLVIGWVIWWFIVAPRGQNPGKAVVGLRVIRTDGTAAKTGWMLVRGLVGAVLGLIPFFLDELWLLWDQNAQTLHDKVAETVVVKAQGSERIVTEGSLGAPAAGMQARQAYAPPVNLSAVTSTRRQPSVADQLRELAQLHKENVITDEEYEKKRSELADRL